MRTAVIEGSGDGLDVVLDDAATDLVAGLQRPPPSLVHSLLADSPPANVPSTRYSRDHGELVSDTTAAIGRPLPTTLGNRVLRTPPVRDRPVGRFGDQPCRRPERGRRCR